MSEPETWSEVYLQKHSYFQNVEKVLATNLGLSELKSGKLIIRNEKGIRENEIEIDHVWIVNIAKSFVGWGYVFEVKFKNNTFREKENPAKLIQGLLLFSDNKSEIFTLTTNDASNEMIKSFNFNLFETSDYLTHGINYTIRIIANHIDTFITVSNPNTEDWKKWEGKISELSKKLANQSDNLKMKDFFK